MKRFKNGLRFWIAMSSVAGFLGGWVLLAHAPKPAQAQTSQQPDVIEPTPLPTLAPIPSLRDSGSSFQQLPTFQQAPMMNFPRMRTGGS